VQYWAGKRILLGLFTGAGLIQTIVMSIFLNLNLFMADHNKAQKETASPFLAFVRR
jgi:hypothetical protein